MKKNLFIVAVFVLPFICACSSFEIKKLDSNGNKESDDFKAVPGIPFYLSKSKVMQQTEFSRTWIEAEIKYQLQPLTMDTTQQLNPNPTHSVTIIFADPQFDQLNFYAQFEQLKSAKNTTIDKLFANLDTKFASCGQHPKPNCTLTRNTINQQLLMNDSDLLTHQLIKNTLVSEKYIDYSTTYYYNTERPFWGSAEADIALTAEGTLTSASSNIDGSNITDVIPIKEILSKTLGLLDVSASVTPDAEAIDNAKNLYIKMQESGMRPLPIDSLLKLERYQISVTLTRNGKLVHLAKPIQTPGAAALQALKFGDEQVVVATMDFAVKSSNQQPERNKNVINLQGQISLPETTAN